MKNLLITLLLLAPAGMVMAQTLKEYNAPNGITYHKGDSLNVALGSQPDGNFKYIQINTLLPTPPDPRRANSLAARKDISGSKFYIKKIVNRQQPGGGGKVVMTIKTGGLTTCDVWIDDAIAACEVKPCQSEKTSPAGYSVADELLKLKKLLDAGAITQAEYDAQKKKLLGE